MQIEYTAFYNNENNLHSRTGLTCVIHLCMNIYKVNYIIHAWEYIINIWSVIDLYALVCGFTRHNFNTIIYSRYNGYVFLLSYTHYNTRYIYICQLRANILMFNIILRKRKICKHSVLKIWIHYIQCIIIIIWCDVSRIKYTQGVYNRYYVILVKFFWKSRINERVEHGLWSTTVLRLWSLIRSNFLFEIGSVSVY